ncbi:mannitol dehydrogenase family protein [Streptosporangium sp. NPDC087985]|uniref:mannitol dehydrogenase family protein n=1 Tax=Streptosporangium sp. NPDC087985 TaxID=3366196 RepID=UPI00380BB8E5
MIARKLPGSTAPRLSRATVADQGAAPVRIVHLGLGNFFRAHQAWYTARASDAKEWGIAAFTGRSASLADALAPQDGLYTLVTRGSDGDQFEVIGSVSAVHPAGDHAAWLDYLRSTEISIITLTVTEAGYWRGPDGHLASDRPEVQQDVTALVSDPTAPVMTAPGRLVAGFLARRAAGGGALTVMSCDNLPGNGTMIAGVVGELAILVDPTLATWIADSVSWATSMVDRITPRTVDADRGTVVAVTGLADAEPVVTEPFSEWVISGDFPGGRPAWESADAIFVDEVAPFEQRKLWLLNGGHSLLAYGAGIRGHETVADAVADPICRVWLEQWWDEAGRHLTVSMDEVASYRVALLERFANPNIRHLLAQIAADGSQKLPVRVVPALRAERAEGRVPQGATRILAAWVCHLRGKGTPVKDPAQAQLAGFASEPLPVAIRDVLGFLDTELASDQPVLDAVLGHAEELLAA